MAERISLGAAIRTMRAAASMSQQDLADAIGSVHSYISHLEANRREPSLTTLRAIARAVNVPTGLLMAIVLSVDWDTT